VPKGSDMGITSMFSQQVYVREQQWIQNKETSSLKNFCPRAEAFKALYTIVTKLKEEGHSIIICLDTNQTPKDCIRQQKIKPYTIEWLKCQTGMDDPFITIYGHRPYTATIHQGRDIDYVLTWNIQPTFLVLLPINNPSTLDHHAICLDIDIEELFQTQYSELAQPLRRLLTSTNIKARDIYTDIITKQWKQQKIHEQVMDFYDEVIAEQAVQDLPQKLHYLDSLITNTLLEAEKQCNKPHKNRQQWSPELMKAGRCLSYWKRKSNMCRRKIYRWHLLDHYTTIDTPHDYHVNVDVEFIRDQLRLARKAWKQIKVQSTEQRKKFLQQRADD